MFMYNFYIFITRTVITNRSNFVINLCQKNFKFIDIKILHKSSTIII